MSTTSVPARARDPQGIAIGVLQPEAALCVALVLDAQRTGRAQHGKEGRLIPELFHACLNPRGPGYKDWLTILGQEIVPIESPRPLVADLGKEENVEIYKINLKALSLHQRANLLGYLARKFNLPIYSIESEIERVGFPIRAQDVIVSFDTRAFV